jgi:diphosphoinositol-polyphosphate diphosphatase
MLSNHIAGVYGTITRFVVTIPSATATYHFFELDVTGLLENWPEGQDRRREWVDFPEALQRLTWKPELVQALCMASFAPPRR